MNQLTPAIPAPSAGIVPSNMAEAIELAKMMAGAKLVPSALQKSPSDCLMVVLQAIRWQMDPFAVAQECSVIQGKLMLSGKLVAAVINSRGNLAERLSFSYSGSNDDRIITVSGRLQSESEARTVSVKLRDARTTANVWKTQPDQQLMYHGARVWARRHVPEFMLGVYSPEEFDETSQTRPAPQPVPLMPAPAPTETVDAKTGEILPPAAPHQIELQMQPMDKNAPMWSQFAADLINAVESSPSLEIAEQWFELNSDLMKQLEGVAPKLFARMNARIGEHIRSLTVAAEEAETS
jgi:hypothetical protein